MIRYNYKGDGEEEIEWGRKSDCGIALRATLVARMDNPLKRLLIIYEPYGQQFLKKGADSRPERQDAAQIITLSSCRYASFFRLSGQLQKGR
ncbi:MAG TPA: hypothetical protein VJH24_01970 [Candidatus Bilamarchaeaceae archaeon]|nr:hypothetical protein [Candidatus Bilamarchaeaceae archaeon]